MKRVVKVALALGFIFSLTGYCFAQQDIEAVSRISAVTVYPDSALITRTANLKLDAGEYLVTFPNIIPEVDENSLRVSGQGSAGFKFFEAQVKKEFLEEVPSEKIKQLKAEIEKIGDEINSLQSIKNILADEKNFLDSIRLFSRDQLPQELATKMPATKDLDDTLKFLGLKLRDNYAQVIDAELSIRDKSKKMEALEHELAQIKGPNRKLKRSIVLILEVIKSGTLDISVSYLVRGASWQPLYDARANFEKSEVEMVSYGIIRQTTGEEWPEVEISLSTAKPAIGGSMPYVSPWILRPYQHAWKDKGVRLMDLRQKAAFEMSETMVAPAEGGQEENIYAQAEEKGIAILYKIPRKATIKFDGSEHKLPISTQILKADFEYSTYPRLIPFAYLGSRVANAENLQLLAGRVNIFLEDDFVGTSSIDNIAPGEEFDLYLGVDENVKVKREQVSKKVDDVLIANIPSPNRKTTLKYKITIENYKSKKIKVIFFEAVPVSENEKIKTSTSDVSLEPKDKDWKDRKGIWRWELELDPKEKKEISYTFSIEHPRDLAVEGL